MRHNSSGLGKDRAPAIWCGNIEPGAFRVEHSPAVHLIPAACRQVEPAAAGAIFIDRADEQGIAEHILVRELAADRVLDEVHGHCTHYSIIVEPGAGGQSIYIR